MGQLSRDEGSFDHAIQLDESDPEEEASRLPLMKEVIDYRINFADSNSPAFIEGIGKTQIEQYCGMLNKAIQLFLLRMKKFDVSRSTSYLLNIASNIQNDLTRKRRLQFRS